ncbi:hypothetical protein, partial [Allorhizocola rhizosphaerae]|uniref:hypothetical protein n=1 Tax=Allorhizocola rhizosphaerae TaxID=1872709 RepID=UPI001B8D1DBE
AAKTPSMRRWAGAMAVAGAGLTTALVATVAATVVDPAPDRAALARVPAALRDDCEAEVEPMTGANSALSCRDAVLNLFPDTRSANEAYSRLVGEAGVATGQGDCADWTGAEHRYPATGPMRGRVLCHERDGSAMLVWTDEQARTVTRADAPAAEGAALLQAWSAWTGGDPAFPTAQERELFDFAAGTDCKRLSNLDSAAIAGVTCIPTGSGAREVSYLRFASLPELRASFTGRVGEAKAPSGVSCAGPDFLGTGRHDWLSVDLGQYLCRPGPDGTLAMEWSMEPLLIAGRVTGSERGALHGWWWEWHLAPLSRIVAAVNARAAPPFPTGPERALLDRIPIASRLNCLRPSPGQVWADIGGVTPVAAVACGRTSGAGLVVYYQFADAEAMRRTFNAGSDTEPEKDCTRLPEEFYGSRPYARGNGSSGTLRCGTHDSTGERYLQWTDERFAIAVYAHWGTEPFAIIDWWRHDAGPA